MKTSFNGRRRSLGSLSAAAICCAAAYCVAHVAAAYLHAQHRYAEIPVPGTLLVERVPDEDSTVLVFHTMLGRAANDALARVVAYRISQRWGRQQGSPGWKSGAFAFSGDEEFRTTCSKHRRA